jgi:hypothetical protein
MIIRSNNKPAFISVSIMTCWSVASICYLMVVVYQKSFGSYSSLYKLSGFSITMHGYGFLISLVALLLAFFGLFCKEKNQAYLAILLSLLMCTISSIHVVVNVLS